MAPNKKARRAEPSRTVAVSVGAFVIGLCASAAAQVNIEPFRRQLPDDRVGGSADVRFSGRTGNTEGLTLGGSGLFGGRHRDNFGFFTANGDYSELNEATQIARYFAHVRYNRMLSPTFIAEAFAQINHNRFQRLTLRRLLGAGPRINIVDTADALFFYAASYMLELETIDERRADEGELLSHRFSNTLGALYRPDDRVTFTTTVYFQPRFDAFSDYRVLNETVLEFRILERLAASISGRLRYDSQPPLSVKTHDFELVNSLGLRF